MIQITITENHLFGRGRTAPGGEDKSSQAAASAIAGVHGTQPGHFIPAEAVGHCLQQQRRQSPITWLFTCVFGTYGGPMPRPQRHEHPESDTPQRDHDVRSHRFRPFRSWRSSLTGKRAALTRGAAATAVVAVLTVGMWTTQGQWNVGHPTGDAAASDRSDDQPAGRSEVREPAGEKEAEPETEEQAEEPTEAPEEEEVEETAPPQPVGGLDETQMANAVTVVEIGQELGFSERGQAVALVTAMQESQMRNVASDAVPESFNYPHEGVLTDHDSVGLFQQRPSMGWGTVEQCMDVEYSTTTFYKSLDKIGGWEEMTLAEAAQAVQISAFPDRYAQWEDMAWAVIDEVG